MKTLKLLPMALAMTLAAICGQVSAQGATAKVDAPAGVKTRADVKADTEKFLSLNRWDKATESWIPVNGKPRDMSMLTRAQVRAETVQFHRTHEIDDATQEWVSKPVAKAAGK